MTASPQLENEFFTRTVTAAAVLAPVSLTFIAGAQPLGSRGAMMVMGHGLILGGLLAALTLRMVYARGFSCARRLCMP
jgi:hypothetical protein